MANQLTMDTPRHKGKVERGVDYVQENALRGREFDSLAAQNEHLHKWESRVADTRIHGTSRKQVIASFQTHEQPALSKLPLTRFEFYHEVKRKLLHDGHICLPQVGAGYDVSAVTGRAAHVAMVRPSLSRQAEAAFDLRITPGTTPHNITRQAIRDGGLLATLLIHRNRLERSADGIAEAIVSGMRYPSVTGATLLDVSILSDGFYHLGHSGGKTGSTERSHLGD